MDRNKFGPRLTAAELKWEITPFLKEGSPYVDTYEVVGHCFLFKKWTEVVFNRINNDPNNWGVIFYFKEIPINGIPKYPAVFGTAGYTWNNRDGLLVPSAKYLNAGMAIKVIPKAISLLFLDVYTKYGEAWDKYQSNNVGLIRAPPGIINFSTLEDSLIRLGCHEKKFMNVTETEEIRFHTPKPKNTKCDDFEQITIASDKDIDNLSAEELDAMFNQAEKKIKKE
jgi:hypothetical protein